MKHEWMGVLATVAVSALAVPAVRADFFVPMPIGSTRYLGMINGNAAMITAGTCTYTSLNAGGIGGALRDRTFVQGTSSTNSMTVVASPTSVCGFNMTALVTNGFTLVMIGAGGADSLWNLGVNNVTASGSSGNDYLVNAFGASQLSNGGDGNDVFVGGSGTVANGGNGDDLFCTAPGTTFGFANGEGGWDQLCGSSFVQSVEDPNTLCSCF